MPSTPPPLWPGYDDAGEDELLALLDGKVARRARRRRPHRRRRGSPRDLAQAIASHEWLKQELRDAELPPATLHSRADDIRGGSWRPK